MQQTNTIPDIISNYITKNELLSPQATIIVGFSGGADSVMLLHYLHTHGYNCIAAHCNFSLRGAESIRDYQFAKEFTQKHNIPFLSIVFNTLQYASEQKLSIEMACRELRYNWFEKLRLQYQAEAIAVAHHKNDSIETFFLNLIRGTGINGLTGIKSRNGYIVRPLLCIGRNEILYYIKSEKLSYITDSTNEETIYTRNKIRLEIIPLLQSINPAYANCISRTMENLRQTELVYNEAIAEQEKKLVKESDEKHYLSIPELLSLSYPETFLYEWLKKYGFSPLICQQIFITTKSEISGQIFYSEKYRVIKDRTSVILSRKSHKDISLTTIEKYQKQITAPLHLTFEYIENSHSFQINPDKNWAYFDTRDLNYPLIIRHWETGDSFTPFGMNGKKKISDYFSDHKYSLIEKENAYLLCSGDDIIWLIGERSSNKYRITKETKEILIVKKH
ncbi:MAG TPA: tRNA lysidine(34) synthetase TilS [Candidatus Gallibacteroides avistercoris]|uniref:tRNA(Ile)-lysidine synthase n=1 Tax=Candidatus Gallibacteroides avistercoris TaxID=2840833 RepID=A0A9D1M7U3_9BACT|nr:tRNA lysidine(34) synthetase TilS [Candidatus Gallibacteroides avistercoris]